MAPASFETDQTRAKRSAYLPWTLAAGSALATALIVWVAMPAQPGADLPVARVLLGVGPAERLLSGYSGDVSAEGVGRAGPPWPSHRIAGRWSSAPSVRAESSSTDAASTAVAGLHRRLPQSGLRSALPGAGPSHIDFNRRWDQPGMAPGWTRNVLPAERFSRRRAEGSGHGRAGGDDADVFRRHAAAVVRGSFRTDGPSRTYDVTPDGQRFLMVQEVQRAPAMVSQMVLVQNWVEELKRLAPTK